MKAWQMVQSDHQSVLALIRSGAIPEHQQVKCPMDELPQALAALEDEQVRGTPHLRPAAVG